MTREVAIDRIACRLAQAYEAGVHGVLESAYRLGVEVTVADRPDFESQAARLLDAGMIEAGMKAALARIK